MLSLVALALPLTGAWVPFPNPPQPLPRFAPSYNMFDSSIIMPCNYTGPFDLDFSTKWGIADIDWSNSKAQWVQDRPMTSEEELVAAAAAIRQRSNNATKVWVYRNLVYAPAWFTDVREKIVSNPEWFIRFKPDGPYNNSKCTFDKCSDLFHSQFQTPEYQSGSVKFGSCDHVHCDCGENVPCGWYLWNHSHPDCRQWLVQEHMMGNMSMGNPNVQGNFIDDEWFEYGPELEGPGSEWIAHDTGMSKQDILTMQADWRKTMDAANAAVIDANGYTWRLFYNNGTCATAPFDKRECADYMSIACSEEAPLEKHALFYGFSGMTGCSPDPPVPPPTTREIRTGLAREASSLDPIIDKIQHLASFLLIRGPYAWIGWAWLGCGNFPFRPPELDTDYGVPLETCHAVQGQEGVFAREYTRATVRVDCKNWEATITPK